MIEKDRLRILTTIAENNQIAIKELGKQITTLERDRADMWKIISELVNKEVKL